MFFRAIKEFQLLSTIDVFVVDQTIIVDCIFVLNIGKYGKLLMEKHRLKS